MRCFYDNGQIQGPDWVVWCQFWQLAPPSSNPEVSTQNASTQRRTLSDTSPFLSAYHFLKTTTRTVTYTCEEDNSFRRSGSRLRSDPRKTIKHLHNGNVNFLIISPLNYLLWQIIACRAFDISNNLLPALSRGPCFLSHPWASLFTKTKSTEACAHNLF